MTLPSQFSLEEENFYKDIQDLVKNGSQGEKELSLFLQRYMDLLARADLDDETFIINFTKAGLIIEASAKVYGTKVDRLWMNLEHVIESLNNNSQRQSKKNLNNVEGEELYLEEGFDDEDGRRKLPPLRRRKKIAETLFSVDDFLEIDNITGLLGKNMNENIQNKESKLKLCEKVPNMFINNKRKKKKVDVCLNKCIEDKDVSRLRDWVISKDCLLIKEIYAPRSENAVDSTNTLGETEDTGNKNEEEIDSSNNEAFERMEVDATESNNSTNERNLKNETNSNTELEAELKSSLSKTRPGENMSHLEAQNDLMNEFNVSKESDMAKFPNVLDRSSGDCLVDVDEVFWNTSKFKDVIPSKKLRSGRTTKVPCQLCIGRKSHKKRGKRCLKEKEQKSLDSFFAPHVQPTVSEPLFGILPDEELYNIYKTEMKLIEQLGKVNTYKNINEAYHPDQSPEELRNFLGFDGFEHCLMKRTTELQEVELSEEMLRLDNEEGDNENVADDLPPTNEFELPFPVTADSIRTSIIIRDNDPGPKDDDDLATSESEYQKLVFEELKDHYATKTSFAKNKELGIKISKWHEMIADKIKLSQKRGALNMNMLAGKIMNSFPPSLDPKNYPTMAFKDLVRRQCRRDVPRYFFACLQLTNERNLAISKSNPNPLTTDCMIITKLRSKRANYDLDDSTIKSPCKNLNSSKTVKAISSKRKAMSRSPSILDSKNLSKSKKLKQKIVACHKRPKNFSSVKNSKRRRCSVSSADSFPSD